MFSDPSFWVAVAFLLFILVVIYFKVPGKITQLLDERSARIANELDEAQRLREESQALFAEYKRKTEAAVEEAEAILQQAREQAAEMKAETTAAMEATLERRKLQAEAKIEQMQAQAVQQLRSHMIDIATQAAEKVMVGQIDATKADDLIEASITDLRKNLN